ncbi:MAG: murein hydrolase transporter LrgA [Pseudomonadales bacterium RIFCSPHIGHO2_12_FULL_40_16]|uniref:CidA/LrgA family protein n=1 Tax=Acinetobacter johnsonii TaxID=40214 RepID=UPI0008C576D9|nr:CidA/LrgA family protein [Acinetobacter johnsonii]MCF7642925.1 CidA/LrgA family protein [Acinetobacter johnsonii]MDA1170880.1 CidA/LrgA family protein [Pseudomonadota bacterium]OFW88899.1 MAG: murein hydrolase transporter LrgA [Acinetobacter sp. RIFCSPHIGHO2_12_41_5]OHC23578.1 MAG: murein hydrolase transporter LrgA [Pseudomonadales bacterium RIFCSPHIGHO2_12_FULL_40_16]
MLHDRTRLKKLNTASYQIIIILAVWSCAYVLQKLLNLPVASGVLGFFLLLFLLEMKWLKLAHVERGADLLLAELLLFFIPPVVGVIQYQDLLIASGWQILLVILISTALVMMVSVYSVRLLLKPPELNQEPKLEDQYD